MSYNNILIVKLSAIGDVIHALPVAPALKKCFPQARITWVVEKTAYDILTNNPYIDEIIIFDKANFKTLGGLLRHAPEFVANLKARRFDLALDLQGLFKSSAIVFLSGASTRLVYENAREGSQLLSRRVVGSYATGHVVERYLDVVRGLGCQVDQPVFPVVITDDEVKRTRSIMAHAGLPVGTPYVVMALGANWPNKIWPAEKFAELCDRLYTAEKFTPVVIGGPGDDPLLERLLAQVQIPPISLVGKTSLKQLAYVIKNAAAFIGGDTGPMHLSAALGIPTIALMGPTDQIRNGPYGNTHRVILADRQCIGCWQRKCSKGWDCLASISVETVYSQLLEIMQL
ncbi:Lipopolysaccharide core heptosyltransferase RfaQ [Sporomusa silvacetica DSM 10669]|uniref:Lipopolysaccharide core heptosyltransferase RfaQ n=1 Tax=Sporomusa silvacetica DSM 10669 TaxID=1123289 RepID=A0ABZ3IRR5_9FIRM|nr:glycosyltransferase family 9 protein [Sporomusa silvacetica]OZC20564.1 lipopolysaccharide core heptosyltransferase RfaQ [Sporomusa silvacetica DSM 10669]